MSQHLQQLDTGLQTAGRKVCVAASAKLCPASSSSDYSDTQRGSLDRLEDQEQD